MVSLAAGATCAKQTHYANARLDYRKGRLSIRPDQTAKREPMPLNITVSLERGATGWGVLWRVPYRDPSAINRTLTTDVWYLVATDWKLRPLHKKPLVVLKRSGEQISVSLAATDKGFAILYVPWKKSERCKEIDVRKQIAIINSRFCRTRAQKAVGAALCGPRHCVKASGSTVTLIR